MWILGALIVCSIVFLIWHNSHVKTCTRDGLSVHVRKKTSCDQTMLFSLSKKAQRIIQHSSIRDTPMGARIHRLWDGVVHELEDQDKAPAVSTMKQTIRLCLKNQPSEDACMFVVIHEMAHIGCATKGHTKEFWSCMKRLLHVAKLIGVYKTTSPEERVCGRPIGPEPNL